MLRLVNCLIFGVNKERIVIYITSHSLNQTVSKQSFISNQEVYKLCTSYTV